MLKKQNGITLIALVITIIVLLILAGVTIAMVVGDNGILTRSREAKDTTNIKKIQEEVDLEAADLVAEYHTKDSGEVTGSAGEYVATQIDGKTINGIEIEADSEEMTITAEKDGITTSGTIEANGHIIWDDENSTVAGGGSGSGEQGGSGGGTTTPDVSPSPSPSPSPAVTITTDNYGDSVNYSTTLNGQTLTNWKIFHKEGNYVWLIYGDFLENAAIPTSTYIIKNGYRVYGNTTRIDLTNYFITKSNWSSLLTGTINGNTIDYTSSTDTKITAMGSPTLELYKNSWNAKYPDTTDYPSNQIYTAGNDTNGYYVSRTDPATSSYVQMSDSEGYKNTTDYNTLYFPYSSEVNSTKGYWLVSPSAPNPDRMMIILNTGYVYYNTPTRPYYACRPVICLPVSVLN